MRRTSRLSESDASKSRLLASWALPDKTDQRRRAFPCAVRINASQFVPTGTRWLVLELCGSNSKRWRCGHTIQILQSPISGRLSSEVSGLRQTRGGKAALELPQISHQRVNEMIYPSFETSGWVTDKSRDNSLPGWDIDYFDVDGSVISRGPSQRLTSVDGKLFFRRSDYWLHAPVANTLTAEGQANTSPAGKLRAENATPASLFTEFQRVKRKRANSSAVRRLRTIEYVRPRATETHSGRRTTLPQCRFNKSCQSFTAKTYREENRRPYQAASSPHGKPTATAQTTSRPRIASS